MRFVDEFMISPNTRRNPIPRLDNGPYECPDELRVVERSLVEN